MKKASVILLIVLVLIQFILPVRRNHSGQANPQDISRVYPVPEKIQRLLNNACYDCHSNNTRYPWYANLQPASWWIDSHIKKGKAALNFNEFGRYPPRRRQSKLKSIASSIEDGTMPLASYTLIHESARLSKADKEVIKDWIDQTWDSLSQNK